MERWKRCGIPKESSQQSISSGIQTIYDLIEGKLPYAGVPRNLGEYQGTKGGQDSARRDDIFFLFWLLLLEHFQFPHQIPDVHKYMKLLVKLSCDFFSGNWIDYPVTLDPISFKKEMSWVDTFRRGVLVALILCDEKSITNIASWTDGDYSNDELDYSKADIEYYVTLGQFLKGKNLSELKQQIDTIKKQSRKRPKLLLEVLEAIVCQDNSIFLNRFLEYCKYFDKKECDKEDFLLFKNINTDGSILWNLAKTQGLEIPELPEEIMDRIMTCESIGLITPVATGEI
jgi:hypothetical protein